MSTLAEALEVALASDEAQIITMLTTLGGPIPDRLHGNLVYPAAHVAATAALAWFAEHRDDLTEEST